MACPNDDTLGAMVDRALDAAESALIAAHLDGCATCREAMLAAVRAVGAVTPATLANGTPSLTPLLRATGSAPTRTPIGTSVAQYELRALLGAGGMGEVYEAYDRELDRFVAVKLLRPELAGSGVVVERLVRESRLMAKVVHPSVITVYAAGRHEDAGYIAMELVRGATLASYLPRAKLSWRQTLALFARAGAGLAAAHALGIVHRDFKPDNVLLELDGTASPAGDAGERVTRVLVTDFGIARSIGDADDEHIEPSRSPADRTAPRFGGAAGRGQAPTVEVRLTATGAAIGTPAYMAPEQLDGGAVDSRADVFAFCASLWEGLYGERPFRGTTADEIRAAMATPPRPPLAPVPRRLVRALERGLAPLPADRWPSIDALLEELARITSRAKKLAIGGGAIALVGVGVAFALLSRPSREDPCAARLATLDAAYAARKPELIKAIATDQTLRDAAIDRLDQYVAAWATLNTATCKADREPAQPSAISACLDARTVELAGTVDDLILDGPRHLRNQFAVLADPARCADPAPGLSFTMLPADRTLRRKVTALRYRAFDAEAARDRGDFATALSAATALVEDTKSVWGPVHAEALYLLGGTQSMSDDSKHAAATLRETAHSAEIAHYDYIVGAAWLMLAQIALSDDGNPERALEYVGDAKAALERNGNPPVSLALLGYVQGEALIQANRLTEGEQVLRKTIERTVRDAPDTLSQVIIGLADLYESQGRYEDAVAAFRDAIAKTPAGTNVSAMLTYRERLAVALSMIGQTDEALALGRAVTADVDAKLGNDSVDRWTAHGEIAGVFFRAGQYEVALQEANLALANFGRVLGERSERYAEQLLVRADILGMLERDAEARADLTRGCEIYGYTNGDGSAPQAQCQAQLADSLQRVGRNREALALLDKAVPVLSKTEGTTDLPNALTTRARISVATGHRDAAITDLEHAITAGREPAGKANAEFDLAKLVWRSDRPRAVELAHAADADFDRAGIVWKDERAAVADWLATDGHPHHQK